jgi:hypothetical protein
LNAILSFGALGLMRFHFVPRFRPFASPLDCESLRVPLLPKRIYEKSPFRMEIRTSEWWTVSFWILAGFQSNGISVMRQK